MQVRVYEEQVRGYWLTDLGQRVEGWVPEGDYERGPVADVEGVPTVALTGPTGFAWHVHPEAAAQLQRVIEYSRSGYGWP